MLKPLSMNDCGILLDYFSLLAATLWHERITVQCQLYHSLENRQNMLLFILIVIEKDQKNCDLVLHGRVVFMGRLSRLVCTGLLCYTLGRGCKYFIKMETERLIHLSPRWGLDTARSKIGVTNPSYKRKETPNDKTLHTP